MIEMLPYIHQDRVNEFGITEFIERTFKYYFLEEIKRLRKTIFSRHRPEYVFALIERAWVGVLNNAIIKAFPENSYTLQEFGIYDSEEKYKGRADLFVLWKGDRNEYNLLFEAKIYEETRASELYDDTNKYFEVVRDQAERYFYDDIENFNENTTYLIPIYFAWIRRPEILKKAKEYFNQTGKEDKPTDFCYLYHDNDQGMWAYGKIYQVRPVKEK